MAARSTAALSRRALFAATLGAVGLAESSARAGAPARVNRPLTLLETHVAGTFYYEARRVHGVLRPGEALVLRREPGNAHDELAIEVFTRSGAKLGYIPRAVNEPFARLMDAGQKVGASVVDVEPGAWDGIRIRLTLRTG